MSSSVCYHISVSGRAATARCQAALRYTSRQVPTIRHSRRSLLGQHATVRSTVTRHRTQATTSEPDNEVCTVTHTDGGCMRPDHHRAATRNQSRGRKHRLHFFELAAEGHASPRRAEHSLTAACSGDGSCTHTHDSHGGQWMRGCPAAPHLKQLTRCAKLMGTGEGTT